MPDMRTFFDPKTHVMRTFYHVFLLTLSVCLFSPLLATSQAVDKFYFDPYVISINDTEPVRFKVRPRIPVTEVILEVFGQDRPMFDDGTNGDEIAYDGMYTVLIAPSVFFNELDPTDVFRPFVGYCRLIYQGTVRDRFNVFAELRTNAMPDVPVATVQEGVQVSPHVINIRAPGNLDIAEIFRILDSLGISGEVDFLNVIRLPSVQKAFYHQVMRNAVEGIGLPIFNDVTDPAVPQRFKGVNYYPISGFFDGASIATTSLIGNQWTAYLGWPFSGCSHWLFSEMAAGVMSYDYGGYRPCPGLFSFDYEIEYIPTDDEYRLTYNPGMKKRYHPLDLYLMGLISANEVDSFMVFSNQSEIRAAVSSGSLDGYQAPGTLYSIEDVISLVGERIPVHGDAQTEVNLYTIILSPELLTRDAMVFYDFFAGRGEDTTVTRTHEGFAKRESVPFYIATGGRATANWKIQGFDFPVIDTVMLACAGESVLAYGKAFSETGEYDILIENDGGVDTMVHLELTVLPFSSDTVRTEICANETFSFNGAELTEPGMYVDTLADRNGCDSIAVLELEVLPFEETSLSQTICAGETVQFDEEVIDSPGTYIHTLTARNGCDSTVTLNVEVLPVPQMKLEETICAGETWLFAGHWVYESGIYFDTSVSATGCDSITILDLYVDDSAVGGSLSFENGMEVTTICVRDETTDSLLFRSTGHAFLYGYLIADEADVIQAILDDPVFDFDDGTFGTTKVYGLAYQSDLLQTIGDTLMDSPVMDGCFNFAENVLIVHKDTSGAACTTSVRHAPKGKGKVKVYPNPATDFILVSIEQDLKGKDSRLIEIHDAVGTCVLHGEIRLGPGMEKSGIPIGQLEPGWYLLKIEGVSQILRFIVQR